MSDYILSCCSTADLDAPYFKEKDINVVYFHYTLDGVEYVDDLGQSMPFDEFYKRLSEGSETQTSQVSPGEFENYFRPFLEKGQDILHVSLSSGLSGVFNSAEIARELLLEEFPNRKIFLVDSLGASSGYGLFMDTLANLKNEGMELEALYQWASDNRLKMHHWFFSTDLSFYVKGGRITKTQATIATSLNIIPVLNMNSKGQLTPQYKVRGRKKVERKMLEEMTNHAQEGVDYRGKCFISQSAFYDEAQTLATLIEEKFPNLDGPVKINSIGTTIGSHTGPGTIALFFWGDERID